MPTKVYVMRAFCKDGRGGNEAGVVLFGDVPDAARKQEIARGLGYSETVFVARADRADFRLEYFTPAAEADLCGHATIAAFDLMRRLGMLDKDRLSFETKAGLLSLYFDREDVFMEQARPAYFEILERPALARCFGAARISAQHPIQIVSTGLRDIMLPVESAEALCALQPRFDEISALSRACGAVGVHAFALRGESIFCRNFAPLYGIPEEAATGTANCALAAYLYKHGILRRSAYRAEQGFSLGSPSEIMVRVVAEGGEVSRIFVGGKGQPVTELSL